MLSSLASNKTKNNNQTTKGRIMTDSIKQNEIITREEASKILGVSCGQIERFKRMGRLPYIKLAHKCVRYRRSDCEKLLDACTIGTKESN